jgi:TolB-like protein
MASIISGYEYDIFISYRQKDNKYDGWVTEFVDNLKRELEATFKEELSVYFDINPRDGLLETHDVDASLKEKLKCLIFIPVISQTYCDSKSFAWQNEFVAFNRMAKEDPFGRDIRLASGNVASRILPVKIHDLDPEDKTLIENELGGIIRSIDFIYKSPGVNRPLRAIEDHPKDNLNRIYYRDQINKLANAIKENITAIRKHNQQVGEKPKEFIKTKTNKSKLLKPKIILASILVLAVIVLGYFFIPKIFKPPQPNVKSIAVLPLENMSDDKEHDWFGDAMTDEIITQLYKIKQFTVRSRTSIMQYKETKKPGSLIGKELKVNYLIEGSAQRFEDMVRIRVQLIYAATDNQLWGETYEAKWEDILTVQSEIARQIADKLQTVLTPEEKELIEKTPTKNLDAYNSYLQGRFFWNKRTREGIEKSLDYFGKSVAEDPDYALAYAGLADAYCILAWWGWYPRSEGYGRAKEFALKALSIDKNLSEAHATLGDVLCWNDWKWEEASKELKLATELNQNYATAHQYYSEILDIIGRNDEARLQINMALELDPFSTAFNATSALFYYNEGKITESLAACRKTLEINSDYIWAYWQSFYVYVRLGEDLKAAEALRQFMLRDTLTVKIANYVTEVYGKSGMNGLLNWLIELQLKNPSANLYIAKWYAMLGKEEEALARLEKALKARLSEIPGANSLPDEIPRIFNSPDFDGLQSERRFKAIIKKMGLSEYSVR